ncbi:MAG: UTP--glucose-1-phosphate uridylyltransferase [Acidimicrobiia bacterium]
MSTDLASQLDALPAEVRRDLAAYGFDRDWFVDQAASLQADNRSDNHVTGQVSPPAPGDVVDLAPEGSPARALVEEAGEEALSRGQCALVVLAGGMATRMGGVVKALVEALPGRTFLDLRLAEQEALERRTGRPVPLWLMTSHATDEPIRRALGSRLDGYHIAIFPQRVSLRLTPGGDLFHDDSGRVSEHSPGHGDLPESLQESGLLARFIEAGGRYVTTANLDNLGATLDPAVVGSHIATADPVTCEVVDKLGTDRGGIPARLDGRPVVLEEFRIPPSFDASQVRVFNTNTFHFDASALSDLSMPWTYFVVPKQVDGRDVIQFERLVNEVASHLDTGFLRVPRRIPETRFLPIKDDEDLAEKRGDVEAVARDRGMI